MSRRTTVGAIAIAIGVAGAVSLVTHDRAHVSRHQKQGIRNLPAPVAVNPIETPPAWVSDDPEGKLILEGLVIGPDGEGVGGADVWLRSVPPRTTKTTVDGTFSFNHLVSREYALTASKGELFGGPKRHKLTSTSEPLLIKVAQAAAVLVTVNDESERPIPGAQVAIKLREGPKVTSATAGDGTVRLSPVQAGVAMVEASAAGYGPSVGIVTVGAPGTTAEVTLNLRAGYPVSGRVVDESGKVVPGARVSPSRGGYTLDVAQTMSDEDGDFVIPELSSGRYMLFVVDGEHAPAQPLPVNVNGAPVTGLEFVMRAGGAISGVVIDAAQRPAPFAGVQAIAFGNGGRPIARDVTCDRDGRFELRGLVRGKLQVHAESEAASSSIVEVDSTSTVAREIRLLLDVEGTITGSVVNERGAPVPDVEVTAVPASHTAPRAERLTIATTTQDGTFRFSGLADGEYVLGAVPRFDISAELGGQRVIAETGDSGVRIALPTPGTLTGRVAITGTASPPKVFSVQIAGPGFGRPVGGTNGVFEYPGVAPGTYSVLFRSDEFADFIMRNVAVESGKATNLGTVAVQQGRLLAGHVVSESGAPVPGAHIKLVIQPAAGLRGEFEDLFGLRSAVADRTGMFTIYGVPEVVGAPVTTMAAIAYDPDHGSSKPITIQEGTDAPPQVTLVLSGR